MKMLAIILQSSGQGQGSFLLGMLPLVFIFGIFYLLLVLPQQKRQKKWREMLANLKSGDRVVTGGGIRGTIIALRDDHVQLRIPPDNLRIEVQRDSIVSVAVDEATKS